MRPCGALREIAATGRKLSSHIAVVGTNTRKALKKHDVLREIGKSVDDSVLRVIMVLTA